MASTTVIPLTYAVKQPLGTNNLTSHVDMCQSNCVYVLMGDSNYFQILFANVNHNDNNFCEMIGKWLTIFFGRNSKYYAGQKILAVIVCQFKNKK
jgi:hypothetical protein